ncbi:PaaI family thioesterase [Pseudorhodoferax sp.]|uniref:PaaI family thioesterase n=1 Tax=Pseudorhodoferax sp. TaxID=1993553 RepID=UPI002DD67623|nr:PaaI family thioesterase [Pseudorhodoferax sp.]
MDIDPKEAFWHVPFTKLLGVRREFSEGGRARLVVDPRPDLLNPIQALHGGVVATLADVVMASAAVSRIGFTRTAVTLSMHIGYLAPGRGRLTADGEVLEVHDGVAHCQAVVMADDGQCVARAAGSFRYLDHAATRPQPTQETCS